MFEKRLMEPSARESRGQGHVIDADPGSLRRLSTNSVHAVDKAALLVARIDHIGDETAPDNVHLWVNPLLSVAPLTNNAVISILSDTNVYDFSFDWVRHFAGNPNTGSNQPHAEYHFDELRIGETYADVTPIVPDSSGQPIKLSIGRLGNQIEIAWTEGTLESAVLVSGLWSAVQGASPPAYRVAPDGIQKYFRVRR